MSKKKPESSGDSSVPAVAACACFNPSYYYKGSTLACRKCGLPPASALNEPTASGDEFTSVRCTNSDCNSHALRYVNGSLVCAECGSVMVKSAEAGATVLVCGDESCHGGAFRRRRDGTVYCVSHPQAGTANAASARTIVHDGIDPEYHCPKCGAGHASVGTTGDGRKRCTRCDTILDGTAISPVRRPSLGAQVGLDACPNCKSESKAFGRDGTGRVKCTTCDYIITAEANPDAPGYDGDACPRCGAPPHAIMPDGSGRQKCTSCDHVLTEAQ